MFGWVAASGKLVAEQEVQHFAATPGCSQAALSFRVSAQCLVRQRSLQPLRYHVEVGGTK